MDNVQFQLLMEMLKNIKELLQQNQQPQTKITILGNKTQNTVPKGLKSDEDFIL